MFPSLVEQTYQPEFDLIKNKRNQLIFRYDCVCF